MYKIIFLAIHNIHLKPVILSIPTEEKEKIKNKLCVGTDNKENNMLVKRINHIKHPHD